MKRHRTLLTLAYIAASFFCVAQNGELRQAFRSGAFEECLTLSTAILDTQPDHGQANFIKGASLVNLKQYREGTVFLKHAQKNNFANSNAIQSMLLQADAGQKDTESLLGRLDSLVNQGFASISLFTRKEFSYLSEDESFNKLRTKVDANANPCLYQDQYKRLDFWIGEWDVFVGGNKSADSYISKSLGGCTLHEDYRTLGGFYGRSFNYHDPQDSLYKQIWIDKFNSITNYDEISHGDGALVMLAKQPNGNFSRMSYRRDPADGSVTQTMEGSTDDGKTWTTNFVGVYKRKQKDAE